MRQKMILHKQKISKRSREERAFNKRIESEDAACAETVERVDEAYEARVTSILANCKAREREAYVRGGADAAAGARENMSNRWHGKRYTLQEMFCAGVIGANISVACCVLILEFAGLL